MGDLTQRINFIFSEQSGVATANKLTAQIDRVTKSANEMALGINNADKSSKKLSDQGLANIQAGLVQLSTYLMVFNQNLNNAFDKALNGFKESDQALNRLRITMGLTGQQSIDLIGGEPNNNLLNQYKDVESEIERIAMVSQFSQREIADTFRAFLQEGKTAAESKRMADLARQMAAASGGMVGLGQASQIVLKHQAALNVSLQDLEGSLDRMVFAGENTSLGLEDMLQAYGSLRGAMQGFSNESKKADAQMFAALAAYKTMGLNPEGAADALRQASSGLSNLYNSVNTFMLKTGTIDLQSPVSEEQLKKAYGRTNQKRNALLMALGITDEFATKRALEQGIKVTKLNLQYFKDQIARGMLEPKGKKLELVDFVELVQNAEKNLGDLGFGAQKVESTLQAAFGLQSIKTFANAIDALEKTTGKKFRKISDDISSANGQLKSGSDESLKSLASRIEILQGAQDALSNSIFRQDIVANGAIDTQTALVSSVNDLVKAYPSLGASIAGIGRGMQVTSGIGTNLGFMLTAAATFSIGLSHAQKVAGVSTKGLGAIMGSFHKVFLAPTLSVVLALGGAFMFAGLMVVAFMKHISGADSIGAGFGITLQSIKDQAMALTAFLKMAFGQGLDPKVVKDQTSIVRMIGDLRSQQALFLAQNRKTEADQIGQRLVELDQKRQEYLRLVGPETDARITGLSENRLDALLGYASGIKSFFDGISSFMQGVLVPMSEAISPMLGAIGLSVKLILSPFIILAKLIASSAVALKGLGIIIGSVFSVVLVMSFTRMVMGIAGGIKNSLVNAIGSAKNAVYTLNTAMNQAAEGSVKSIDRVRAAYKLLSGDAAGASAALGRDLSQVPAQRQAHLDELKAQQQTDLEKLKQEQRDELKRARLDRGTVYAAAVQQATTVPVSSTGKPLRPTVNRGQVKAAMQVFDDDLKQMAVRHQQQLQQLIGTQQGALVQQMQDFDDNLAKQEKVMRGRFASMANDVGSSMDKIGARALGPLGGLTLLSGAIGALVGDSSTFGYIINTWVTPMLGLLTTMALLASTGFFTLAAGVIAATWPLLAAVAAIVAGYYAVKALINIVRPASAEPMTLVQKVKATKPATAGASVQPAQALAAQAGVILPQLPQTPTTTPASNPASGFVTPVSLSGGNAAATEVKTTNIQTVNVTINNKEALTAKQAEKIMAEGIESASNGSNSIGG